MNCTRPLQGISFLTVIAFGLKYLEIIFFTNIWGSNTNFSSLVCNLAVSDSRIDLCLMSPSYTNSFFIWAVIARCWSQQAVMLNYGEDNQKCTTDILERDHMIILVKFLSSRIALLVQFTSISSARWHLSSDLYDLKSVVPEAMQY